MSIFDTIKRLLGLDQKPLTPLPKKAQPKQDYVSRSRGYSSDNYLIEIRFFNRKIKSQMKELEDYLDRKFGVGAHHYVPHVTLVGGFTTSDERRLINDFFSTCSKSPIVTLSMEGFDSFEKQDGKRVVYFDVQGSEELKELRYQLSQSLMPYCKLSTFDFDKKEEFAFHETLANNVPEKIYIAIKRYLEKTPFKIDNFVVPRITLLKNGKIMWEYDFFLEKLLNRDEARNPEYYCKTENGVQKYLAGKRSKNRLIPASVQSNKPQTFIYSDTHFDHKYIISYCNRPFSSVGEMNQFLVNNWNYTVKLYDTVYLLGDLSYGKKSHPASYWADKLYGRKIFIKGSHDNGTV